MPGPRWGLGCRTECVARSGLEIPAATRTINVQPVRQTRGMAVARKSASVAACLLALLGAAPCSLSFAQPQEQTESSSTETTDWAGCLVRPSATIARVSPSRIRFCGRITAASVEALRASLEDGDHTLEITSLGGELDAPIDLGEVVAGRRLDVEVIGPCLSGCASYAFAAGTNRIVRRRGWLALHNTNTSAAFLVRRAKGGALETHDAPLRRRAEREQSLYSARGVSASLLLDPQARIGTECVAAGGRNDVTRETEYRIVSRVGFWAPTRAQWRSYGVSFEGYSPRSAREALRVARASLPEGAREAITIVHVAEPLPQAAEVMLSSVTWCSSITRRG